MPAASISTVPVSSPPSPPQPLPLEATGWRTSRLEASRGYIDAGLGSWLNSTLSFGYTIIDDSDISAGVRFQHNSTSLWNPEIFDGSDVCRQRYDERIGFPASPTGSMPGLSRPTQDTISDDSTITA